MLIIFFLRIVVTIILISVKYLYIFIYSILVQRTTIGIDIDAAAIFASHILMSKKEHFLHLVHFNIEIIQLCVI